VPEGVARIEVLTPAPPSGTQDTHGPRPVSGYARLLALIDAEAERCEIARAALGITPVS